MHTFTPFWEQLLCEKVCECWLFNLKPFALQQPIIHNVGLRINRLPAYPSEHYVVEYSLLANNVNILPVHH